MLKTLLLTDIVDSTALTEELGDVRMSEIWVEHDRIARELLREHQGREADRTDGFLLLFDHPASACIYANHLHEAFAGLSQQHSIDFKARIGIHTGEVIIIEHTEEQKAAGAKPIEVEGIAKPAAARVMSIARGGQTLMSSDAHQGLNGSGLKTISHGHWRMKGVAEPLELFEAGTDATHFHPPEDGEKVYRVNHVDDVWVPVKETRHNLARERDRFIGRTSDLHRLSEILNKKETHLVTLLGPGGTGKTRLSKRFGRMWLGDYPGGVWFCDLSEARSLDGLIAAVAAALDVPLTKGEPVAQLGNAIHGRGECLIILDNFEQVTDMADATLGEWLARAPEAKFLVTTRILLQLPGEKALELKPLPIDHDAVLLFETRAKDRKSEFQITDENRADVHAIVEALDGMPLAIELAAARIAVLQPRQIREKLGQRFKLLTGKKGVARRQQTLRAAIDWSWDILDEWERSALAQCSVFEGGFTLEAAEEVIDLAAFPDAPMTMDVIQSLADKSLLRTDVQSYDANLPWFGMYVSIKEYAAEMLKTEGTFAGAGNDGERACHQRYIEYYAGFGSAEAIDALHTHGGLDKRKTLNAELDNLFTALGFALDQLDDLHASMLLKAAWQVLKQTGPIRIIKEPAETLLQMEQVRPEARLRAYMVLHGLALSTVDRKQAEIMAKQSLQLAREIGDKSVEAFIELGMAYLKTMAGAGELCRQHAQKALVLARETGDANVEAIAHQLFGIVFKHQNRFAEAKSVLEEGLAIARKHGNVEREAAILDGLGSAARDAGDQEAARHYYEEALPKARDMGNRFFEIIMTSNIGQTHLNHGESALALRYFRDALSVSRAVGDSRMEGGTLLGQAMAMMHEGDLEAARELITRSLEIFGERGDKYFEAQSFWGLARVDNGLGAHELALANCQKMLDLSIEIGNKLTESVARKELGVTLGKLQRKAESEEQFQNAERLLREIGDERSLASLMATWAGALCDADDAAARAKLAITKEIASRLELHPKSEACREIDRVEGLMMEYGA